MGMVSAVLIAAATWLWLGSSTRARLNTVHSLSTRSHLVEHNIAPRDQRPRTRPRARPHRRHPRRAEERAALLAQAPVVADLLATAVSAGASVNEGVSGIADAVDEPMRTRLRAVEAALHMGAGAHSAWSPWLDEPSLAPIAQAIIRSQHSGAPVSSTLDAAASDMRQAYRADVQARARAAGVRAVAPLALCFLPAFLLVGVVPVVAGFAGALFA